MSTVKIVKYKQTESDTYRQKGKQRERVRERFCLTKYNEPSSRTNYEDLKRNICIFFSSHFNFIKTSTFLFIHLVFAIFLLHFSAGFYASLQNVNRRTQPSFCFKPGEKHLDFYFFLISHCSFKCSDIENCSGRGNSFSVNLIGIHPC